VGKDPVRTISDRLEKLINQVLDGDMDNAVLTEMNALAEKQANGEVKTCPKFGHLRPIADFKNPQLKTGMARHCISCR
jgi:hypothetical protein